MDLKSAIDILSIHNDWRRDDTGELPQVHPKILGEAIDFVVSEFKNLHLQNVSNRRELLIAFAQWLAHEEEYGKDGSIGTVDAYLESN